MTDFECIVCGGITFTQTETGAWACDDCEQTYWDDRPAETV